MHAGPALAPFAANFSGVEYIKEVQLPGGAIEIRGQDVTIENSFFVNLNYMVRDFFSFSREGKGKCWVEKASSFFAHTLLSPLFFPFFFFEKKSKQKNPQPKTGQGRHRLLRVQGLHYQLHLRRLQQLRGGRALRQRLIDHPSARLDVHEQRRRAGRGHQRPELFADHQRHDLPQQHLARRRRRRRRRQRYRSAGLQHLHAVQHGQERRRPLHRGLRPRHVFPEHLDGQSGEQGWGRAVADQVLWGRHGEQL